MSIRSLPAALAALSLFGCASAPPTKPPETAAPAPAPPAPPPVPGWKAGVPPAPTAPVRDVVETHFGVTVHDPYRWMEAGGPELEAWLRGQDAATRAVLAKIPGRPALLERMRALSNALTDVGGVVRYGGRLFYTKLLPGSPDKKLFTREGWTGKEALLLDPTALGAGGVHVALDWFTVSWDGRYVAYGLSKGGSEDSVLHVLESATGKVLADEIDGSQYAGVAWLPDGKSFFHLRIPKLAPGAPATDRYRFMKTWRHVIGADPAREKPLFGNGVAGDPGNGEYDFPMVLTFPGSKFAVGIAAHGVQNEVTAWVTPLAALEQGAPKWTRLCDVADAVTNLDARGDELYLLRHRGAPRFEIVRTSFARPDLAKAEVVVPQQPGVLRNLGVAKDALYAQVMTGGPSTLLRIPWGKAIPPAAAPAPEPVAQPFTGAIGILQTDPREPGVIARLASAVHPPQILRTDGGGPLADTGLTTTAGIDTAPFEELELQARSADGTQVPCAVSAKKGLARDGSHPALLDGYGAYGIAAEPYFSPTLLGLLEQGAIHVEARVRGGGEYGEEWHQAGMKGTKQHSIDDFLACAQAVIDAGFTSAAHLAGTGTSAGGIVIGGAVTQRPELFAAAIPRVADLDTLRSEVTEGGPANVPEFGSAATEEGFKALLAMDAFQHVKEGVRYPALLVTTGINDPRVPPWMPAKFAARVQAATASEQPVLLRVDFDAGHGLGSTRDQAVEQRADEYAFLLWQTGHPAFQVK